MAKLDKWEKRKLALIQAQQKQIEKIFNEALKEAASIGAALDAFNPDKPFTLTDYPRTKKQIDALMAQLKEQVEVAIVNGVRSEWTLANNKNNELCNHVFGDLAKSMPEAMQERYYSTNPAAMDAFLKRKTNGLNLSDRVWNYTEQFKTEIELGLDIGMREGMAADKMTRLLRDYLKYPDKLFRRVRDEHGNLRLSQAAAAFHPGRGVYRSSFKNARRLAATECNIAYRSADHERWQQLDFVVGIKIEPSNTNHEEDICDFLAGKYPKDFKWTGWHPHCRCHALTILKTEDEMMRDNQRIAEGKEPLNESANSVEKMPKEFEEWVKNNKGRIEDATERGKLPYFLKDNPEATKAALAKANPKSPLEIAKERHANRTPEQARAIQEKWDARKQLNGYQEFATANGTKKFNSVLAEAQKAYREGKDGQLQGALAELKYRQAQIEAKATKPKASATKKAEPLIDLGNTKAQKGHVKNPQKFDDAWNDNAYENRIKQIMKDTGVDEAKAKDFEAAIAHYTGDEYTDIRKWLSGERGFTTGGYDIADVQKWAEDCEAYIHAAPKWKGGLTQRGMCMSHEGAEELVEQLKQGKGDMRGCSSWTTKEDKAWQYANDGFGEDDWKGRKKDTRVILQTDTHTKATSIQHLSIYNEEEAEVLASLINQYEFVSSEYKKQAGEEYLYIKVKPIKAK